jgi:hypothetical protein
MLQLSGSDPTWWVFPLNPNLWQSPWQKWDPFQLWLLSPTMYRMCRMRSRMTHKIIFAAPFYRACGA